MYKRKQNLHLFLVLQRKKKVHRKLKNTETILNSLQHSTATLLGPRCLLLAVKKLQPKSNVPKKRDERNEIRNA